MATNRYTELREQHCADYDRLFPQLLEQTYWSTAQLRDEREVRLRKLLRVAKERSPWHATRLASVSSDSFDVEDLHRLPSMTKGGLMDSFDAISTDPRVTLAVANGHVGGLISGN